MDTAVLWRDLLSILAWMFGSIVALVLAVIGAGASLIWFGARWTKEIESVLKEVARGLRGGNRRNDAAHRFLWHVMRRSHPDLPEELPISVEEEDNGGARDL